MKLLKKVGSWMKNTWLFIWNNKITGTLIGVGTYAGYCIYSLGIFTTLWANILLGFAAAVIVAILSIYVGGEKLSTIIERLASVKLTKEEAAKAKEIAKKAELEAKAIQAKYEELKAKKEAEDKARLEAEAKALVDQEKSI